MNRTPKRKPGLTERDQRIIASYTAMMQTSYPQDLDEPPNNSPSTEPDNPDEHRDYSDNA